MVNNNNTEKLGKQTRRRARNRTLTDAHIVTVSTGVQFVLKSPSVYAVQRKQDEVKKRKPPIPVVFVAEKQRNEEVPDHPDYQSALQQWQLDLIEVTYDALLATGTTVEHIPAYVPAQDSEEHKIILQWLGLEPAQHPLDRYIQWVKYTASPSAEDFVSLIGPLLTYMGTPIEEVNQATQLFRGNTKRDTNLGAPTNEASPDGHSDRGIIDSGASLPL